MDPNIRSSANDSKKLIASQLKDCFAKVVYSHKTHEKCADIAQMRQHQLKLGQIILSALSTTSIFFRIFGTGDWVLGLGAFLSTLLLVLNIYTKDYNYGEMIQKHRETAAKLWRVREEFQSLLVDFLADEIDAPGACKKRDSLNEELASIYQSAPPTFLKGYLSAQVAIKQNQEATFNEGEIDALLPHELRESARAE